jgi:hypothetical protein
MQEQQAQIEREQAALDKKRAKLEAMKRQNGQSSINTNPAEIHSVAPSTPGGLHPDIQRLPGIYKECGTGRWCWCYVIRPNGKVTYNIQVRPDPNNRRDYYNWVQEDWYGEWKYFPNEKRVAIVAAGSDYNSGRQSSIERSLPWNKLSGQLDGMMNLGDPVPGAMSQCKRDLRIQP